VFDDELNRIAEQVGSRAIAFQLVQLDHKLVRFYLPLRPEDPQQPVWSVIRQLAERIGEDESPLSHHSIFNANCHLRSKAVYVQTAR